MRFNQAGKKRAVSRRACRAGAAIGALLLLAGCASFHAFQMSSPASARDEWLTAANADKVLNAMGAKGMMPQTIDCRFDNTTPGQLAYGTKFTWQRAPAKTRWHWEVGDPKYLASKEVKSNRIGLRQISAKIVQDPATGQKVGCSIWANWSS